ncbi:MAG: 16S rRNA (cytosine(1402)-N(4))-methyltransferase RsmH [Prevotellaceae bacterium]|jgi:16S rRNA (cytosine1402-N4)-methyltransferase|nr:16S rRNA (cytosine(1402)-N(4))-methyltransferase RsmH [Prevotellaceae bacterium]
MTAYHIPVLLHESVDALCVKAGGTYIDATYGGGSHAREILRRLPKGRLLAFDRDADADANCIDDRRLTFIRNNFRYIRSLVRYEGVEQVDGILADLGVSSHQFDTPERGFSFRFEAALDMRMNRQSTLTAAQVLNTYSESRLQMLFKMYGEVENAPKVARCIVDRRHRESVETVGELVEAIRPCMPRQAEHKYLATIFQALRMEVNAEMQALEQLLAQSLKLLKEGGRLVVITYHSLEDRMVKNFMRTGNVEGQRTKDFYGQERSPFIVVTKKAIIPKEEEIRANTRARSAKLRVAEVAADSTVNS